MSILALIGLALFCLGGMAVGMILLVRSIGGALEELDREHNHEA